MVYLIPLSIINNENGQYHEKKSLTDYIGYTTAINFIFEAEVKYFESLHYGPVR